MQCIFFDFVEALTSSFWRIGSTGRPMTCGISGPPSADVTRDPSAVPFDVRGGRREGRLHRLRACRARPTEQPWHAEEQPALDLAVPQETWLGYNFGVKLVP